MKVLSAGFLGILVLALACLASAQQRQPDSYYLCTSTITGNFNGTAIAAGDYVWFTGVLSVKGLGSSAATVFASHSTISFSANGTNYTIKVPSSTIRFSPSTTLATTKYTQLYPTFLGIGWNTQLQVSGLAGNDLMTAVKFAVPASGLPGGIHDVTFTATFSSYTPGLTVNWQWAAAAYSAFSNGNNLLGVKPVDDNKASNYKNSDHAGTPENYKQYVVGGATGGGGSNYTGSYSGTGSCALTADGSNSFTF
jgi:hypothetical protein